MVADDLKLKHSPVTPALEKICRAKPGNLLVESQCSELKESRKPILPGSSL